MAYRESWKRRKVWSIQANKAQERNRMANGPRESIDIDPYIKIEITRRGTGEYVVFECLEGSRIDNYSVYCGDKHLGIMGISKLMKKIGQALPAFRQCRM